jgi:hypothetical protein
LGGKVPKKDHGVPYGDSPRAGGNGEDNSRSARHGSTAAGRGRTNTSAQVSGTSEGTRDEDLLAVLDFAGNTKDWIASGKGGFIKLTVSGFAAAALPVVSVSNVISDPLPRLSPMAAASAPVIASQPWPYR